MRDKQLHIKCSPEEHASWHRAAQDSGTRFSDWVRNTLNVRAGSFPALEKEPVDGAISDGGETLSNPEPLQPPSVEESPVVSEAPSRAPYGEQCRRWMFHRKGVYCGACARTI